MPLSSRSSLHIFVHIINPLFDQAVSVTMARYWPYNFFAFADIKSNILTPGLVNKRRGAISLKGDHTISVPICYVYSNIPF